MTPAQQVLAKLLISNELLNEKQCASVFKQVAEPEEALARLVKGGHISDRVGTQLLEMYRQQVAALEKGTAAPVAETSTAPATPAPTATPTPAKKAETAPAAAAAKESAPSAAVEKKEETKAPAPGASAAEKTPATAKGPPGMKLELPQGTGGKQLMHALLKKAREMGASDVHIIAGQVPAMRFKARLVDMEMPPLAPETARAALLSILDEERRNHFVAHRDLDFCYDGGEELGRFRTNFMEEQNGTAGIFRLISPDVPSLESLGMPDTVRKFTTYAVGIVLITGPKGCGKTTTLASMVDLINRTRADHVITIEDPIEFVHPCKKGHINQREVGTHTKTFGAALRAALREAPNVIVVGEMRDLDTTSLAVTAAETGHLVIATLHTPDAIRTIGRVLDVFPPKEQGQIRSMLSESLRGVVSQQLVPSKDGSELHLALEILVNTSAIGNMIREDRAFQLRGAMQTGKRLGMMLMDDSLIKLLAEDKIGPQEAVLRASDPEYIMRELPKVLEIKKARAAS